MSGGMSDEQLKERIEWLRKTLDDAGIADKFTEEQIEAMRKELKLLEGWQ
jgi:hypothetical protein